MHHVVHLLHYKTKHSHFLYSNQAFFFFFYLNKCIKDADPDAALFTDFTYKL